MLIKLSFRLIIYFIKFVSFCRYNFGNETLFILKNFIIAIAWNKYFLEYSVFVRFEELNRKLKLIMNLIENISIENIQAMENLIENN